MPSPTLRSRQCMGMVSNWLSARVDLTRRGGTSIGASWPPPTSTASAPLWPARRGRSPAMRRRTWCSPPTARATPGKIARVVSPGPGSSRGWSPRRAARRIRRRFGCAIMTGGPCRAAPRPTPRRAAVFDALETARVEALGSRTMAGVRANLDRHCRGAGAERCDRPGADRGGSAAGDRGRADRAAAADRGRAARRRRRRGWRWCGRGSRRRPGPSSTRWR